MIELREITKSYESGGRVQVVLDGISLRLAEAGMVCVLGKSGCGKTTLLNVIGGLDREFGGDVLVGGTSCRDFTETAWDRYRAQMVGFVFQEAHLVDHLSVADNVRAALSFQGSVAGAQDVGEHGSVEGALARCGIAECADKFPAQLSGGQAQRAAIARAIVKDPQVLLADEPTGSLDSASGRQVMDLLAEVSRDHLVVVVTHDRDLASRYADRIIELADGAVARDEPNLARQAAPAGAPAQARPTGRKREGKRLTMLGLAWRHCANKKARAAITAAVASIGLFGMVAMMALNAGAQSYMADIAAQSLLRSPIQVKQDGSTNALVDAAAFLDQSGMFLSPDAQDGVAVDHLALAMFYAAMENRQSCDLEDFMDYVRDDPDCTILDESFDVQARYDIELNVYDSRDRLIVRAGEVTLMDDIDIGHAFGEQAEQVVLQNLPDKRTLVRELICNERTGESPYEVRAGRMPASYDELVVVTNGSGHVTDYFEYAAGIANLSDLADAATNVLLDADVSVPDQRDSYSYDELLGLTYHVVPTCDYYYREDGAWQDGRNDRDYMETVLQHALELKVVGVVAPRSGYDDGAEAGSLAYSAELMPYLADRSLESDIVKEQKANPGVDVFTGEPFNDDLASESAKAAVERDRRILAKLLEKGDFSQVKRDYVNSLAPEQVQSLRSIFSDYIGADGTVSFAQSDIDAAAALPDDAFIAAVERYAPAALNAQYEQNLKWLGAANVEEPSEVCIYAKSFQNDADLKRQIDAYNDKLAARGKDPAQLAYANEGQAWMTAVAQTVDAVSRALLALVAVALAVSVVMVFSVTYVSAIERRREVALLRAMGAPQRAIRALFNWENLFIGAFAGLVGALAALAVQPFANFLIGRLSGQGLAMAAPWWSVPAAIAFGAALAVLAGLIPATRAAKSPVAPALK